jgi:EmrB/QacA subfamily drug resistance transporter
MSCCSVSLPIIHPRRVLLAASLGVLVAQIDTSVVTIAVQRIGVDLGLGVGAMQWTIDAYNLAYASLLLTAGVLGDRVGARRLFVAGVALFAAGSACCAVAPGIVALLAGRALSGVGAALELPMSLVLLTAAYPEPAARQRALGMWASCNGVAFVVGPALGGLLVDHLGWRSIFYVVIPLCTAALALAPGMPESRLSGATRTLDLPGQAGGIAALGGLAFAAIEGAHRGWSSAPVIAAGSAAVLGAVLLVHAERGNAQGLMPFILFRSRPFSASLAVAGLMTFGMYGLLFLLPLYCQTALGDTPLQAGLRLLPLALAFVIVSQFSRGIVHRLGFRATLAAGMAAMGTGELLCSPAARAPVSALLPAAFVVVGIGLGLATAPLNNLAVASAPADRAGTASGLLNAARMAGATLGVAVLGTVFAHFGGGNSGAAHAFAGLESALGVGGAIELAGAAIAAAFVPRALPA